MKYGDFSIDTVRTETSDENGYSDIVLTGEYVYKENTSPIIKKFFGQNYEVGLSRKVETVSIEMKERIETSFLNFALANGVTPLPSLMKDLYYKKDETSTSTFDPTKEMDKGGVHHFGNDSVIHSVTRLYPKTGGVRYTSKITRFSTYGNDVIATDMCKRLAERIDGGYSFYNSSKFSVYKKLDMKLLGIFNQGGGASRIHSYDMSLRLDIEKGEFYIEQPEYYGDSFTFLGLCPSNLDVSKATEEDITKIKGKEQFLAVLEAEMNRLNKTIGETFKFAPFVKNKKSV